MQLAQKLYEGMKIGGTTTGLITYMRTDSIRISPDSINAIRLLIESRYGKEYLPEKPRVFATKSKNAQEAHEAIRPVSVELTPEAVKQYLDPSLFKLYQLIWRRTVASQMIHATMTLASISFLADEQYLFKVSGSQITHQGFLILYGLPDEEDSSNAHAGILPHFSEGEIAPLVAVDYTEHTTEPPPRFSEASLVKMLEEYGIGRPSTYASIIATIVGKKYVTLEDRQFHPTDTGIVLNDFLYNHFGKYVDYTFTASLEDILDAIARGETEWLPALDQFWKEFEAQVTEKDKSVTREEAVKERVLGMCPETNRKVSVRYGKYGLHVQIGTRDDEEKPKFGPILPGMKAKEITLKQALELCTLPRTLGKDAADEEVVAGVGFFGPYIRYRKNKFISLKEISPLKVELSTALTMIEEKDRFEKEKLIREFPDSEIKIQNGIYGPYISTPERNVKIPKTIADPKTLTLAECQAIIDTTPVSRFSRFKKATTPKAKKATTTKVKKATTTKAKKATTPKRKKSAVKSKKTTAKSA